MTEYIHRAISPKIEKAHRYYQIITLTGPRQSGKSTLCRHLYPDYKYVSLENISTRALAMGDPIGFLGQLGTKVIIDEVQNVPELLSQLQVMVDEDKSLRYILTGSSNFALLDKVTQSLAGRTAIFTLLPFSIGEIRDRCVSRSTDAIMVDGFYPGVIAHDIPREMFYDNYYNTYVERDLRSVVRVSNIYNFDKFMRMLALRVGSECNHASLSREVGVSAATIAEWMSLLETSYIAFHARPFFQNGSKRLTKTPKVFFYDTGVLCNLLGITTPEQLESSPLRGAVFENLVISELMKNQANQGKRPQIYFYRETAGIEVDALFEDAGGYHLFEIKSGKTLIPSWFSNMKAVANRLNPTAETTIIYDGPTLSPSVVNFREI